MSGGGSRAAAFALGGLRALADLDLLGDVSVISGISGGSLAAAVYAFGPASFGEFDDSLSAGLRRGLTVDTVRRVISPAFVGTRVGAALISLPRAAAHLGSYRSFNRTDALADVLRSRFFGDRLLSDVARVCDVVLSATDLRTTNAVRFGSGSSACSAYGTIVEPVEIAEAVAASAAFPVLLPPVRRTFTFESSVGRQREYLSMSDGGIYDNLATSVFESGRSTDYSQHVYDVDYLVVCDAGRGRLGRDARLAGPWRLKRAFDVTYRKAQDRSRHHLYDAVAVGEVTGVVHAYLGMDDGRLPVPIPDLVSAERVRGYATNFSAMTEADLDAIATRGEQLVRVLAEFYCPELVAAAAPLSRRDGRG